MNQTLESQQTPHSSPLRSSCGVSIVGILEKINCVITAPQCIWDIYFKCFRQEWLWDITSASQWRHNVRDSVSNHQPRESLLSRLIRRRSKKTSKLRVTGFCAGNSPETGEFPAKRASNAEIVSIWWRHGGTAIILVAVILPAVGLFFVIHCHIAYIWPRKYYILLLPLCRDNYFRITSQMFTCL